ATVAALAGAATAAMPALAAGDEAAARAILDTARDPAKRVSIIYAVPPFDARAAGNGARAAANLAIAVRREQAAAALYVLPTEANVNGARDMGIDPLRGPGGVVPAAAGMTFDAMIDAATAGTLKAMIVVGDNPPMFAPGRARIEQALAALDLLVVIDGLATDTAKAAHAVFADVPSYAKTGTYTNADRRVSRLHAALSALGDARPALLALTDLANAMSGAGTWTYAYPDAVTDEIAATVAGYAPFHAARAVWSKTRVAAETTRSEQQPVAAPAAAPAAGELLLTTHRALFTSLEGASVHAADADKLHREDFVELHPSDAAALRLRDEDEVRLRTSHGELALRVRVTDRVLEGVAFVPSYYGGGAITRLLGPDGAPVPVTAQVAALA
ncbi:MAG TPA: molybdopterin dinucleotide binding domain-containing protein, partial [Dehalococcoidia bacterium]|nr:molybdopterin dinucleotide binding domain-containing protein [Dehalococcoidia bacterium]